MRRVKYFKLNWIPSVWEKDPDKPSLSRKVPGSGVYEKELIGEATFHSWGVEHEEYDSGPGNLSTAIIELDDGTVVNHPVEQIQFIVPISTYKPVKNNNASS